MAALVLFAHGAVEPVHQSNGIIHGVRMDRGLQHFLDPHHLGIGGELTSLDKTRLYPVPLGNLSVALKAFCPPGPAHVDRRYLNPEPQVAPDPKFNR